MLCFVNQTSIWCCPDSWLLNLCYLCHHIFKYADSLNKQMQMQFQDIFLHSRLVIRCVECEDIDLCPECFAARVELGSHRPEHSYKFIDNRSFSLFNTDWTAWYCLNQGCTTQISWRAQIFFWHIQGQKLICFNTFKGRFYQRKEYN